MKRATVIAMMALAMSLTGCDRYRVTLNDRPISEPLPLLTDFAVTDSALAGCIQQAIIDQGIRRKEELKALVCSHAGITSVDGIEAFSQLHTLNLAENNLTTIAPLMFLGNLTSISLENNSNLNCKETDKLLAQLPKTGKVLLPAHCLTQQ